MSQIWQIRVVGTQVCYSMGLKANVKHDPRIVGEIKDLSLERENGIDFIYEVMDENGKKIARIENAPVVVEYISLEDIL